MPKQVTTTGKRRHRVTIQQQTPTPDGQGGSTLVWSTFATVWTELVVTSAHERVFSQQVQYQRSHSMTIRYLEDLNTNMQCLFDGRTFQIKGIRPKDERKFYMQVDLMENVGT
jgi:SPP1 family predicted phage head-tail adaptor